MLNKTGRRDDLPAAAAADVRVNSPKMFSVALSITLFIISFGTTAGLMLMNPELCWAPRIGGTIVGLSVLLQGYMFANPEKFQRILSSGITMEQRVMHIVYLSVIFGTFLWAWGDLLPDILGVPNSICLK